MVLTKRALILGILILAIVLSIAAAWKPTISFETPQGLTAPEVGSLIQTTNQLLPVGGSLPQRGSQLVKRGNHLEWEPTAMADQTVADVKVRRVQFDADRSLLFHLLDDDPQGQTHIDVLVTTDEGITHTLRITLWDYARVTPLSPQRLGDGWKPVAVTWEP